MTLPRRASRQIIATKQCSGRKKMRKFNSLHDSLYKTQRNWVNGLTRFISYLRSVATNILPKNYT
jgi:hypothetical protein